MIYAVAIIAYVIIVIGGIRFFQTVHRWDDQIRAIHRSRT
jgi:hypothetical protein